MPNAYFNIQEPKNEPYLTYAPGTSERIHLKEKLQELKSEVIDIPAIINGQEVYTENRSDVVIPHNHGHKLATLHQCGDKEINMAIEAALEAQKKWAVMPWEERVAIFRKAADLVTGTWRYIMNASTMLGQSKTAHQAEIEAAGELADFLRFNAWYLAKIMNEQPHSPDGVWNRVEYRPLEGFIFAVSPFNFTAIAGNLPTSPAMCGNVVLWKPSTDSVYSNFFFMKLLKEAGLPDGVINFVPGRGAAVGDPVLASPHFSGIHYTGSVPTFNNLWKTMGENIDIYKTYPRIVGETGGKDFIFAHNSADIDALVVAALRAAFEYQGQKCSAASRMYVSESIWPVFRDKFLAEVANIKVGDVEDFTNFMGAVISRKAYSDITAYIDFAKEADDAEIIAGGNYDDSRGYFIEPTVILTSNPSFKTMEEEIFGPVLTIFVYKDEEFDATLDLCDQTSPFALTGAVFAKDRYVIKKMSDKFRQAAGNFYINEKPTGAVVNQQPFGGSRKSGTNDKAGSIINMLRWLSARAIKEVMDPPKEWRYPFMEAE
ncbi:MAG: L-glutamate gamma-semialdehyde dehydrogenase [Balneolaceae bacterium]|nr:MAG: L-glutamate gamma-semialdehyde dehydrogenase [Balneolaceae bacterium]